MAYENIMLRRTKVPQAFFLRVLSSGLLEPEIEHSSLLSKLCYSKIVYILHSVCFFIIKRLSRDFTVSALSDNFPVSVI
jgi:hypothetical protein